MAALTARAARRVASWIKGNPARRLARKVEERGRRKALGTVGCYLAATLASTYALTALFTPAAFTDPAQVAGVASRTGAANVLMFGVPAPLLSGAGAAAGGAVRDLGSALQDDGLASLGSRMQEEAAAYFETGLGMLGDPEGPEPAGRSPSALEWDPREAPGYYAVLDGEEAVVDEAVSPGQYVYGELDELGRATQAKAGITLDEVRLSSGWRAGFADDADSISGWGENFKAEVPYPGGGSYSGWFWNRSHLIADSLGGYEHVYDAGGSLDTSASKSHRVNLIAGTRMQNVGMNGDRGRGYGGMARFERLVADYLEGHPRTWVYYAVEPVYVGDELIPRACRLDVRSSDWDGAGGGLNFRAVVYNAALGYDIDYKTGRATPS